MVLTTGDAEAVRAELLTIEPRLADDLTVRHVEVTEAELGAAVKQVSADHESYFPDIAVHRAGVDLPDGEVVVTVPADRVEAARSGAEKASDALGVPVTVEAGGPVTPNACTGREYCTDPMRAGTLIRKGSTTGSYKCTMGFHILRGTANAAILTSGHCGYSGSNYWYHKGWGSSRIGREEASMYRQNGVDIMRVNIGDGQYSQLVYTKSGAIRSAGWPTSGATVCARLGMRNVIDCGVISNTQASFHDGRYWTFGTTVGGISSVDGDSGSPIWQHGQSRAVGVHHGSIDSGGTAFANVQEALNEWNARIP